MRQPVCTILEGLIQRFAHRVEIANLAQNYQTLICTPQAKHSLKEWTELYDDLISAVEPFLITAAPTKEDVELYQSIFLEQEKHIARWGSDSRHHFVITIPVADRPLQLERCLDSLLQLCTLYGYGGMDDGLFQSVRVLIVDDSLNPIICDRHAELARDFTQKGLETLYFSEDEQRNLLLELSPEQQQQLRPMTGPVERESDTNKGASITRNIAYLKLQQLGNTYAPCLFFFIDSDQEFRVPFKHGSQDEPLYAINYLYQLDKIFTQHPVQVLTGNVVGDPSLPPSVMANNMLNDLVGFFEQIAPLSPSDPCVCHQESQQTVDDAAFHDMTDLLGYHKSVSKISYECPLQESHNNLQCLEHFATQLAHFFDGEHPTRKSHYQPENCEESMTAARTLNTSSYVFNYSGLDHFIPYAELKLHMAGPVLGRLIKARIGEHFVSANLPMSHKCTVTEADQTEGHSDVERGLDKADLGTEFERQFYGEVMLSTIESLCAKGYPLQEADPDEIDQILDEVTAQMLKTYQQRHDEIIINLERLDTFLRSEANTWINPDKAASAMPSLRKFITELNHSFSSETHAYAAISEDEHCVQRRDEIRTAIMAYREAYTDWQKVIIQRTDSAL